ncbi:MAG: IclR family transcriptional regulator [Polaromonas sp.]|uniref:IclR family transcriptional regulator n=1 Tax=Polaromonas sp. TaxID=1869339 RepID=UPI0025D3F91C|nr:IclR family transcriptional regulator [Polaromonas sp.]MBI2728373.1 IclR family transcriptional regulator [Polaromonas sp.]
MPRTTAAKQNSPRTAATPAGPGILESVGIVFDILDKLTQAGRPLGVTELAQLMNEPKPRVYRHLASMRQLGVVEQEALSEKYRLGARLVGYGAAANNQFDLRALATPYLNRLRDATGETAVLSVADQASALVIASADSANPVCISVKPGNRVPVHSSAQGRIVLAWCDAATQRKLLKPKLQRFTDKSSVDPQEVLERLARIRERLYEDANGEMIEGVNVLAAPIFSAGDELVGVIGIIGAARDVPSPPASKLLKAVQGTAAEISARLGSDIYERPRK